MNYVLDTSPFTGALNFLHKHGDLLWGNICDVYQDADIFEPRKMVNNIEYLKQFKPNQRLKYLRLVLNNMACMTENIHSLAYGILKINVRTFCWAKIRYE